MRKHRPDCECKACRIRRNWRNESPLLDALVIAASGAILAFLFIWSGWDG